MLVKSLLFFKVRKGKELKVPHHASAAATRDNHVPNSRQLLKNKKLIIMGLETINIKIV